MKKKRKLSDDEWRTMKRRFDENQRRLAELIAAAKAKLAQERSA